jgi:hypothetical protein
LEALVRRIPEAAGADAAVKARLAKLATDANVAIKTGNLRTAGELVEQLRGTLRDALDAAGISIGGVVPVPATQGDSADAHLSADGQKGRLIPILKASIAWRQACSSASSQLARFREVVEAEYAGDEDEMEVLDGLTALDEFGEELNAEVSDLLDNLINLRVDGWPEAIAEAIDLCRDYSEAVKPGTLADYLEGDTPFGMRLSVASTYRKALENLENCLGEW